MSGLVTQSPVMRSLVERARLSARSEASILITGETGSGKERIAQLVHQESRRAAGPFVPVNCGALPEALVESELFGHARGAFSGAHEERQGLFETADGGRFSWTRSERFRRARR